MDAEIAREGLRRLKPLHRLAASLTPDPGSDIARVCALESAHYMRNQLLRDADWAGMAHSLEIRVPLVDFKLASHARPRDPSLTPGVGQSCSRQSTDFTAARRDRDTSEDRIRCAHWRLAECGCWRNAWTDGGHAYERKGLVSRVWSRAVLKGIHAANNQHESQRRMKPFAHDACLGNGRLRWARRHCTIQPRLPRHAGRNGGSVIDNDPAPAIRQISIESMPEAIEQMRARPRTGRPIRSRPLRTALCRLVDIVFCGHLFIAPLAALIARLKRAKLIVQTHGIEAWPRPYVASTHQLWNRPTSCCVSRAIRAPPCSPGPAIAPERVLVCRTPLETPSRPETAPRSVRSWVYKVSECC